MTIPLTSIEENLTPVKIEQKIVELAYLLCMPIEVFWEVDIWMLRTRMPHFQNVGDLRCNLTIFYNAHKKKPLCAFGFV